MNENKIYSIGGLFFRLEGRTKTGRWRVRQVTYFFDGKTLSFIPGGYCKAWTEQSFLRRFTLTEYNVEPTTANTNLEHKGGGNQCYR